MTLRKFSLAPVAALTTFALLSACGGGSDDPAGWQTDGNVKLQFAAYNGAAPITCDSKLKLGTKARDVKIADMRFYIANVNLIKEDGGKVALKLKQTDNYNYTSADGKHSVSLIDLEQKGVGLCDGSPATNPVIEGTVPAGRYTGAEMVLGVPFEINHLNAADASTPAVLQTSVHPGMSWNWRGGRKFTNIEFDQDQAADATPWESAAAGKPGYVLLHLGSTGCLGDPAKGTPVSSCSAPNRVPLSFASFDPAKQVIALDAAALFNYDIASKREGVSGCMSSPTDRGCTQLFDALALDFGKVLLGANNQPELDKDGFAKIDGKGTGLPIAGKTQSVFKLVNK
ncbi:MbnP family copper-binding protein [Ottowia testudinis]|uniref:Metallo-mystery pair system four-Cys motif protein n=1 Tax=Ottowia testudinis TaxID=2816950 RepID=A0A975CF86_9BURK|nr:MbnP family copper-binding protein [Ottowia testudinis]QTD45130.1 metallo-mystery pair system four-Cys motif protein [Ottowia testudinis]